MPLATCPKAVLEEAPSRGGAPHDHLQATRMKALRPVLAVDLRSLALSGHEDEVPDAGDDFNPVWSPDGTHVAFASTRTGLPKIYVKPADGSGEERLLAEMPGTPTSWSSDGRFCCSRATLLKPQRSLGHRRPAATLGNGKAVHGSCDTVQRDSRTVLSRWSLDCVHIK